MTVIVEARISADARGDRQEQPILDYAATERMADLEAERAMGHAALALEGRRGYDVTRAGTFIGERAMFGAGAGRRLRSSRVMPVQVWTPPITHW